ncbi:MAG: formyl transferase, partial [Candidatus Rokubacteria bacterium]|nr:formyl transferase [Candidatus Rokubacteria bacterium]
SRASGKGVIAWMQRVAPGRFTQPETVLQGPHHLSYPYVFEHEGAVWMIPETAQARRIELYRARAFPRSWERVAVLLDEVNAVDATLLRHDRCWWMFANIGEAGSSTWDELFAFHADSPLGPWKPHAANPVKSDVRSARPAGRLFRREGRLIRPAQDCSRSYGGSLALCEVLELTPTRYRERVIAEIGPEWLPGNLGFHTLSFSERIEFIDGKIARPRDRHSVSLLQQSA